VALEVAFGGVRCSAPPAEDDGRILKAKFGPHLFVQIQMFVRSVVFLVKIFGIKYHVTQMTDVTVTKLVSRVCVWKRENIIDDYKYDTI